MSEDVIRPRPVVDPTLSETPREGITRETAIPEPPPRRPKGETATRPVRLREGGVQVLGAGFTVALAVATAGWYLGLVVASVVLVGYVIVLGCGRETHPTTRTAGLVAGAGTVAMAPVWILDVLPREALTGTPWLVFLVFLTLVAADALTGRVRQPADDHHGAVLLPDDISDADHARLVAVQRTIDLVEAARDELGGGDSLDTDRALTVLREQEWRIASLLARQRELRRAHLRRWQRASSPRVRAALKPQREHLGAVDEAVRTRVEEITEYGRLVEQAVAAHREWEQCQEALDSTAEYAEHLASAAFLGTDSADIGELSATADLARQVRDERVRLLAGHPLVMSG